MNEENNLPLGKGSGEKIVHQSKSAGTNSTSPFRNNKGTMVNRLSPLVDYYLSYFLGGLLSEAESMIIDITSVFFRNQMNGKITFLTTIS